MSLVLAPIVELYRWGLQPVVPFSWFGIQVNAIEVAAAVRLCLILRQARELIAKNYKAHAAQATAGLSEKEGVAAAALGPKFEEKSLVRDLVATLIVVHGGDAIGELNNRDTRIFRSRVELIWSSSSTSAWCAAAFPGFGGVSCHVCVDSDGNRMDPFCPGVVSSARTSPFIPGCVEQDLITRPGRSYHGFDQPIPTNRWFPLGAARDLSGTLTEHSRNVNSLY